MDRESPYSVHPEPSRHYREVASVIRHRLPAIQDEEIYSELSLLAAHYERLAQFADSLGRLAPVEG
jgi:hypothetical protein